MEKCLDILSLLMCLIFQCGLSIQILISLWLFRKPEYSFFTSETDS